MRFNHEFLPISISIRKKTFVRLMDLILDAGEADRIFPILEQLVDLDTFERERLKRILDRSNLSGVIKTLDLIHSRYKVVSDLKKLVFNRDLEALEVPHIQGIFEAHYWLIGEKYNLVTAAEPDFIEALKRYRSLIYDKHEKIDIDHRSKNREMDLFMVRQDLRNDTISNIVVELKRPGLPLGRGEFEQLFEYQELISKQREFNSKNELWEFYLIGSSLSDDEYIARQIKNASNHGGKCLAFKVDNFKLYVKTWSDIMTDFEVRHDFVSKKLELAREKLAASPTDTADDMLSRAIDAASATT